uniref:Nuclear pore complex protein Nup214 n=1 Tax=Haemonchus contortus TaxID=6289 RepID=A0A7I4YZU2_HAECO
MSAAFTCRPLHNLPPLHEFVPPSCPAQFHHRLVVASKYNIAVALANNHELVAFRSSALHQPSSGIIGDAKIQTKITRLDSKVEIVSIGLNADETFLGVLGSNPQGCFVFIFDILTLSADVPGEAFPISTIRIGNSASKGLAFEWNPAISDMFAASDNERTLSVAKIDPQNSSKYSMVGEKKLEANISEISWSPKGKQLVVGDVRGKIYQLKPELELVRTTNAPENAGNVLVINLSWLSTTDWLVAYSNPEMTSIAAFMLSIKKDKPPSWTPVNFSSLSSLGVTRRLLVDWNVALVVSPSSADLVAICKPANAWTTTSIASLPQPSNTKFAIGVAVDLSNQAMVTIGDGSSRRLPVVILLYSDGSVLSLQLAPPSKDYPDCNVAPVAVDASKITNGLRPTTVIAATPGVIAQAPSSLASTPQPTPFLSAFATKTNEPSPQPSATSSITNSSFGVFGGAQSQQSVASAPAAAAPSFSSIAGAPPTAPVSAQKQGTGTLFSGFQGLGTQLNATTTQPATTPPTGLASVGKAPAGVAARTPEMKPVISSNASLDQKAPSTTPTKQVADSAEATKNAIAAARSSAKTAIETFSNDWHNFHELLHSFCINMQKVESNVDEAVSALTHADNAETVEEIQRMVIQLDDELQDMLAMLADRKVTVDERMALAKECKDSQLIFGPSVDPFERLQSERVLQKYEDFTLKLHEAKKLLADTKKISTVCKPRRVTQFDPKFEGRIYESMKNLSRYSSAIRLRVEELERKVLYLTSRAGLDSTRDHSASNLHTSALADAPSAVFSYVYPRPVKLDRGASKAEMRARLLEVLRSKKDVKATIKKFEALRFDSAPSDDTLSSSFLNASNIESSLTQKIASPPSIKPVLATRNVSTQADAPPQAQPKMTAATNLPLSSLSTKSETVATAGAGTATLVDNKKTTSTNIAPIATSTPATFKFTTGQSKPGGSLFSSAFSEKQPSATTTEDKRSQDASLAKPNVSPITSKPLFGGSSASPITTATSLTSKPLFGTTGTSDNEKKDEKPLPISENKASVSEDKKEDKQAPLSGTAAVSASDKKDEKPSSLFGGTGTLNVEKKEEKVTSIFGGLGTTANATSEKKDEKPTSLFGSLGSNVEKKDEKPSTLFGKTATSLNQEQKEEKPSSIFGGGSVAPAVDKKDDKPPSIFGGLAQTAPKSIFGKDVSVKTSESEQSAKPPESAASQDATKPSVFGSPKAFGQAETKTEQGPAQTSAFGSIFGSKPAGAATAVTTSSPPASVTFSFKPKTAAESQPAAASTAFSFGSKPATTSLGFAAAAASAAATADTDEGMDDDGAAGGTSQATSSIFGGGFMSGIGSSSSANAAKNVFGMGTSNLLKNAAAKQETSSIFSKGGQTSVFGSGSQPSTFASAAQKAAQSSSPITSSVFGSTPKFGGPPVFGGKPVFGSPTQASTAFGGGAATSGGFSAFSGNKNLFGGVASSGGGSSLFGGGLSSQTQQKPSSLFGGGQHASSFSTWR